MSDRIAVMQAGRIVQTGTPAEVYARPRSRFVAEFLGTANIFPGIVEEIGAGDAGAVRLDICPERRLPVSGLSGARHGQRIDVAVRPENLAFAQGEGAAVRAEVISVIFRGSHYAYELKAAKHAGPIFASSQGRAPLAGPGQPVGLAWPADGAVALAGEVAQ